MVSLLDLAALGSLEENYSSSLIQFSSRRRTKARNGRISIARRSCIERIYRVRVERVCRVRGLSFARWPSANCASAAGQLSYKN